MSESLPGHAPQLLKLLSFQNKSESKFQMLTIIQYIVSVYCPNITLKNNVKVAHAGIKIRGGQWPMAIGHVTPKVPQLTDFQHGPFKSLSGHIG